MREALARLLRRSEVPEDPERYLRRTIVDLTVDLGRRNTRWVIEEFSARDDVDAVVRIPQDH